MDKQFLTALMRHGMHLASTGCVLLATIPHCDQVHATEQDQADCDGVNAITDSARAFVDAMAVGAKAQAQWLGMQDEKAKGARS